MDESGKVLTEKVCIPEGCFEFIIRDSYGDGICCTKGDGYYTLTDASGKTYIDGNHFEAEKEYQICANQPVLTSNENAPQSLNKNILVFPNPVISNVHVQLSTEGENVSLSIVDLAGKVVQREQFNTHKGMNLLKMNTQNLVTGTYLVYVQGGNYQFVEKIVIKH